MKNLILKKFDDQGKLIEVKKATMQYTWGEGKEADRVFQINLNDGWVIDISLQKIMEEFIHPLDKR